MSHDPGPSSQHADEAPRGEDVFDWDEALRFKGWPKFPEQNEDGIDLSLIRENLKLTPEERLLRMERGRRAALELIRIGREQRTRSNPAQVGG